MAEACGWHRTVSSLILAAGVAATALGIGAEAKANQQGLFGEVWFSEDLAGGSPFAGFTGNTLSDTDKAIFLGRIEAIVAQAPYGTFTSTAVNYENPANTTTTPQFTFPTVGTTIAAFLGSDALSFSGGATTKNNLRNSVWRFTGFVKLAANQTYDFRVSADDGHITWIGDGAGDFSSSNAFKYRGEYRGVGNCCNFTIAAADEDRILPFQTIFWENTGQTAFRVAFSTEGRDDPESYTVLGGDMLTRDSGVGVIPLPASVWLLLSGLAGLGALQLRRRSDRAEVPA